jgi:DNA repair protein RadA/Sms
MPLSAARIAQATAPRVASGMSEFDRVMGGGLVDGAFVLAGGDPGAGKSSLVLQVVNLLARSIATDGALYATAEETAQQVALRAERFGIENDLVQIVASDDVDAIIELAQKIAPTVLAIDSIQKMRTCECDLPAGSPQQVQAVATRLERFARTTQTPVIAIGQVTKDGAIAGPKSLEHTVDVVLYLEVTGGARRRLIAHKNRMGSSEEAGVFEMRADGLACIEDIGSQLSERAVGVPGSAVFPALLGERVQLVEVQALVGAPKSEERPRGSVTVTGVDAKRVQAILAILARHIGIEVSDRDVFVSVTAGLQIKDPAADLAIALAIASSYRDLPIDPVCACFGELGLAGEVRGVGYAGPRADECKRQGFAALKGAKTVSEAIAQAIGEAVAS